MTDALPALGRRLVPILTALCLLASVGLAWHFVGSSNLVPGGDRQIVPIGQGDYALQYYYGILGGQFLHESGVPYGYDPRFLSGYVKTPVYYPSSAPFEFSLFLFRGVPPALVFNWTVFVLLALLPLLLYRAAVNFGLEARERLVLAVLLLIPPQALEPQLWLYTIMTAAGMVAFVFTSFVSVYVVSLVYRFLVRGHWSAVLPLAVAAPLLFALHPTAPIFTAVPVGVLYLANFRRMGVRRHLAMWAIAVLVVAFLWPVIQGFQLFHHYSDLQAFDHEEAKGHFTAAGGSLLGPIHSYLASPSMLARVPLVLGAMGLVFWWRGRDLALLLLFGSQIAALTAVTYYGDRFGLAAAAPGRFTLPLALYLFMPTTVAAVRLAGSAWRQLRRLFPLRHPWLVTAAVLLLLPDAVRLAWPPGSRTRTTLPAMQMASEYAAKPPEFAAWLESNTDATGRILHEETSRFSYQYYGTYLGALLPLRMNREFANGPAPYPLLQQNVLRFMAGQLQERPLEEVDRGEFRTLLERYNVRWVLCWTDECKAYLAAEPATAKHVSEFEKFDLYRVEGTWSAFLRGTGNVTAIPNLLSVSNAVADGDSIVLRYHWDENLKVDAPMELFPVEVPGDPVPFLGVRNPAPTFRIAFDY